MIISVALEVSIQLLLLYFNITSRTTHTRLNETTYRIGKKILFRRAFYNPGRKLLLWYPFSGLLPTVDLFSSLFVI